MHTLLATGPVITGTHSSDTTAWWMIALMLAGALILAASFHRAFHDHSRAFHDQSSTKREIIQASMIVSGILGFAVGAGIYESNTAQDNRSIDMERLEATISDRYELDQIAMIEGPSDSTAEAQAVKALCAPVSPKSPELVGVSNGRQITFKVGVTDCEKQNPVAEIIVTDTPGLDSTATELEKEPT